MKKMIGLILAALCLLLSTANAEKTVAAEGCHALALDGQGRVWAWGSNHRGESVPDSAEARILAPVTVMENVCTVACGQQFSMAVSDEGTLYMWGDNRNGQIPGSDAERVDCPTAVWQNVADVAACDARAAMVTTDGKAYLWGDGAEMTVVSENAAQVAVGADFVLIRTNDGGVWFAGNADYLPEGTDASAPVKVLDDCALISASGQTCMAVGTDGTLWTWGAGGTEGRLGLGETGWVRQPTKVSTGHVAGVFAGLTSSAVVDENGGMYVWGSIYSCATHFSDAGEPVGTLVESELIHYGGYPVKLYDHAACAAFGDAFAVVILTDGTVCTWGSNDQGQLATGAFTETAYTESDDDEDDEDDQVYIVNNEQCVFPVSFRLGE